MQSLQLSEAGVLISVVAFGKKLSVWSLSKHYFDWRQSNAAQ